MQHEEKAFYFSAECIIPSYVVYHKCSLKPSLRAGTGSPPSATKCEMTWYRILD